MNTFTKASREMPVLSKVFYIALGVVCLMLGVIGLVLPVIPGIVFLVLAAIFLARVSTRFDSLLKSNSTLDGWRDHVDNINSLPIPQRIKLGFLLAAKTIVTGLDRLVSRFDK